MKINKQVEKSGGHKNNEGVNPNKSKTNGCPLVFNMLLSR